MRAAHSLLLQGGNVKSIGCLSSLQLLGACRFLLSIALFGVLYFHNRRALRLLIAFLRKKNLRSQAALLATLVVLHAPMIFRLRRDID